MTTVNLICNILANACVTQCSDGPKYLSDLSDAIAFSTQSWGTLCLDCSSSGVPLQIGDATYAKGIGTHAISEIFIELDGKYTEFQALVGLQWQDGDEGSVIFKVLVDDKEAYVSPVMRKHDPAYPELLLKLTYARR